LEHEAGPEVFGEEGGELEGGLGAEMLEVAVFLLVLEEGLRGRF